MISLTSLIIGVFIFFLGYQAGKRNMFNNSAFKRSRRTFPTCHTEKKIYRDL